MLANPLVLLTYKFICLNTFTAACEVDSLHCLSSCSKKIPQEDAPEPPLLPAARAELPVLVLPVYLLHLPTVRRH